MKTNTGTNPTRLAAKIRRQFLGESDVETLKTDLRVILYSHDTMGIGHMRRNLLIASHIKAQFPHASILAIAGAKEACLFAQSADIDCLTLPSFHKRPDGTYASRNLGIPAEDVLELRGRSILSAVQSYQPDLLIVDKVPSGAGGELLPTLEWLSLESNCHCVLGLRDILDEPKEVICDWEAFDTFKIIQEFFPSVWIYGDSSIYDAVAEYAFPSHLAERVAYTGYMDTSLRLAAIEESSHKEPPFVLCTIGGGQDGEELPRCFVDAIRATGLPAKILTGPYMTDAARAALKRHAEDIPALEVITFVSEGDLLIKQASHVVSMGGYNTLSAILTYQKPSLIVPRVKPRKEQLIRANRLAELGYVDVLHPDDLSASAIADWLTRTPVSAPLNCQPLEMSGLQKICDSIGQLFPQSKRTSEVSQSHA